MFGKIFETAKGTPSTEDEKQLHVYINVIATAWVDVKCQEKPYDFLNFTIENNITSLRELFKKEVSSKGRDEAKRRALKWGKTVADNQMKYAYNVFPERRKTVSIEFETFLESILNA